MKRKVIGFCGIMTALAGAMIGLAVAEVSQNDFQSSIYNHLHVKLALVGAGLGAVAGAGQEAVREMKAEQDRERDQHKGVFHDHGFPQN
jgi:Holliday junction resolvasome RuvABC endonuclease subunit